MKNNIKLKNFIKKIKSKLVCSLCGGTQFDEHSFKRNEITLLCIACGTPTYQIKIKNKTTTKKQAV